MAYAEQTVTSLEEVCSAILSFAALRGWTVAGSAMTRPGGGEAIEVLSDIYLDAGRYENNQHIMILRRQAVPTHRSIGILPRLTGVQNNPQVLTPTKVHLFGNDAPYAAPDSEPFIAAVIECGFNSYRHVYIGNIVKFGSYTGGELFCVNSHSQYFNGSSNEQNYSWISDYHKYLFRGRCSPSNGNTSNVWTGGIDDMGWLHVEHPDSPNPWRRNQIDYSPSGTLNRNNGNEFYGGMGDGPNDGYVMRGKSDFAGSNILVPYNLFGLNGDAGADYRIRPLGYVSGCRAVHMDGIEPGASIAIGSRPWRVFPEFSKKTFTTVAGIDSNYMPDETSWMLGVAYPED